MKLEDAVGYAKKLVSKTHVAPQPADVVYPGVFGVTSAPPGEIKSSALKQYGLLEGDKKGYKATALAKQLAAATPGEMPGLYATACTTPRIFKKLYEVFHGDTVSVARIRQQALALEVHPDTVDVCTQHFISSILFAGLGTQTGDNVTLSQLQQVETEEIEQPAVTDESSGTGDEVPREDVAPLIVEQPRQSAAAATRNVEGGQADGQASARSVIQINVTLDSSHDPEKLEKQLALLRRFGAL